MRFLGMITVFALLASIGLTQEIRVTSFNGNGQITWSNSVQGLSQFSVEWASSVDGPWTNSWQTLVGIWNTQSDYSASVPMFYRVVGTAQNNLLVWADMDNGIRSCSSDGSGLSTIITNVQDMFDCATYDPILHKLYGLTSSGILKSYNVDGSCAKVVRNISVSGSSFSMSFDSVNQKILWSEQGSGRIRRCNSDGSGLEALNDKCYQPVGISVVDGAIYWTQQSGNNGSVWRSNLNGSFPTAVSTNLICPTASSSDFIHKKVYWVGGVSPSYGVWMLNLDGSGQQKIVSFKEAPLSVSVDPFGSKVYWCTVNRISRSNLDGSGVEDVISAGQPRFVVFIP